MLREIAILRASILVGCAYEEHHHRPLAAAAGLTQEQVDAVKDWRPKAHLFDEKQQALLAYVDQLALNKGDVDDATFAAMEKHFSPQEIVELTMCATSYYGCRIFMKAMRIQIDDPHKKAAPGGFERAGGKGTVNHSLGLTSVRGDRWAQPNQYPVVMRLPHRTVLFRTALWPRTRSCENLGNHQPLSTIHRRRPKAGGEAWRGAKEGRRRINLNNMPGLARHRPTPRRGVLGQASIKRTTRRCSALWPRAGEQN